MEDMDKLPEKGHFAWLNYFLQTIEISSFIDPSV